jgi:hypothetical protein
MGGYLQQAGCADRFIDRWSRRFPAEPLFTSTPDLMRKLMRSFRHYN